jgi:zinc protease
MRSERMPRAGLAYVACLAVACAFAAPAHATLPIQSWKTEGGAQVLFVESHALPMFDVAVTFPAGSARDPAGKSGLASLVYSTLNGGGGGLTEDDIATRAANVGAQMGGDFDLDRASVTIRTLSGERERNESLTVMAAVIQHAEFPEAVFERERARVVASLKEAKTQPGGIAEKNFYRLLYPGHPYGQASDEKSVTSIVRDDLVGFYRRHFTSDSAVVAIIGDLTRSEAEAVAVRLTGELPRAAGSLPPLPPVAIPTGPTTKEIAHPSAQSHIVIGYPGLKRTDPDYFPLLVGNFVLGGGGFSSRLTEQVREKRGLAYSVSSYFLPLQEAGPFHLTLQTRRDQSAEALKVVRETVREFIAQGPTDQELDVAKHNLTGGFPLRIDSNKKILDYLSIIGFYGLPLSFLDDYSGHVEAVTLEQVKDAFRRRLSPDNMLTVVVGGVTQAAGADR